MGDQFLRIEAGKLGINARQLGVDLGELLIIDLIGAGKLVARTEQGALFVAELVAAFQRLVSQRSAGAALVEQVDRLVGQETVGDVSLGKHDGLADDIVVHDDAVVFLVIFLDAGDDLDALGNGRLADLDGLETAFQGGILFDVFAVLVEGSRADHLYLAA